MHIIINNEEKIFDKPTRIIDMFDNSDFKYMAARVNNRLRELNYEIKEDSTVELLDLKDDSVSKIYQATLRYIIVKATKDSAKPNK